MSKRSLAILLTFVIQLGYAAPVATADAGCQFVLGFKSLHDLASADVGDCTDNQAFAANGNAENTATNAPLKVEKKDTRLNLSLYNLAKSNYLNKNFALVGFARAEMSHEQYRNKLNEDIRAFTSQAPLALKST